ncbi:hypothetical protein QYE76_055657 [Lolium multiflorum]|uniref:Reverse transcriptase domain-containing protein n=1 Tax=Lolium multiflorum TaxID=4521 RepID=A0AAD8T051_LOLMU|nr:hypothetical protein QYE76_055657 [Lolium multiflorum]
MATRSAGPALARPRVDGPLQHQWRRAAARRLPAGGPIGHGEAIGPDMRAKVHGATIKQDVVDVFQQLFQLRGRGFHRLNQALMTLLPKRADAAALGDYRPISLIHLIAKLFAKTLSLRLAPHLDGLVSTNQNAFIGGRSLHDNFLLVKQSARLLHQLGAPRVLLKLDLARAFDSISWPFLFEALR